MDKPFELRAQVVRMEETSLHVHPFPLMMSPYIVDRRTAAKEFAERCASACGIGTIK